MTAELEERLGWFFAEPARLLAALTHSTFANENPGSGPNNERLEFLGDAVLDLLVGAILFNHPADLGEGEMSRRRAQVVCQRSLADLARDLGLSAFLRLGVGQERSGETDSILADAYEALVGAVFLDGGYEAVVTCFYAPLARALEASAESTDHKTQLQELCHQLGIEAPEYRLLEISGPDHDRRYTCEVWVAGRAVGRGSSSTKKAAEQICAEEAITAVAPIQVGEPVEESTDV